jgi:hypothetical protein
MSLSKSTSGNFGSELIAENRRLHSLTPNNPASKSLRDSTQQVVYLRLRLWQCGVDSLCCHCGTLELSPTVTRSTYRVELGCARLLISEPLRIVMGSTARAEIFEVDTADEEEPITLVRDAVVNGSCWPVAAQYFAVGVAA